MNIENLKELIIFDKDSSLYMKFGEVQTIMEHVSVNILIEVWHYIRSHTQSNWTTQGLQKDNIAKQRTIDTIKNHEAHICCSLKTMHDHRG